MVWTNGIYPNRETPPLLRVENTRAHLATLEKNAFPLIVATVDLRGDSKEGKPAEKQTLSLFFEKKTGTVEGLPR